MNSEFLIISIILIITYIFIRIVFKINIKEIKQLGENKELDELTNKYPTNIEICKEILSKLNNTNVKIEEDKDANSAMYFILGNKIFIGNLKNSYTRIQTIAHECLHSIQDKRLLWTNFIFANVYNIIFVIVCILAITKIIKTKMILDAEEAGCKVIGGKGMLLYQGVEAFKLFMECEMPVEEVKAKYYSDL